MANKQFGATINIGATLSATFRRAINGAKREMSALGKFGPNGPASLPKGINLPGIKPQELPRVPVKDTVSATLRAVTGGAKREMDSITKAISETRGKQLDIAAAKSAEERKANADDWLYGAKARLREARQEKGPRASLREEKKYLEDAKKEFAAASAEAAKFDAKLKSAGINTKKLTEEEKKLDSELRRLESRLRPFARLDEFQKKAALSGSNLAAKASVLVSRADKVGDSFGRATRRMAYFTAGVAAATYATYKFFNGFADGEMEVMNTASALNITTGSLKQWNAMAAAVGMKKETVFGAFRQYTSNLEAGSERTIKTLDELHLSQEKLKTLPLGQQILIIAKRMNEYKGAMSRAAMTQSLFGEEAVRMQGIFQRGIPWMEEQLRLSKESGYIYDKSESGKVEGLAAAFNGLELSMQGLRNTVALQLAPAMTEFINSVSDFVRENRSSLQEWARGVAEELKNLLPQFKQFLTEIPGLAANFATFTSTVWTGIKAVVDLVGGWKNFGLVLAALNFAPTILAVGQIVAMMGPWGLAIGAVGAAVVLLEKNWDSITEKLIVWRDTVSRVMVEVADKLMGALKPAFDWIGQKFDWVAEKIRMLGEVGSKIGSFFSSPTSSATGTAGTEPAWGAGPVSQQMLNGTRAGNTQSNSYNINVNAPGQDGRGIANGIRREFERKPLFDSVGVLAPN